MKNVKKLILVTTLIPPLFMVSSYAMDAKNFKSQQEKKSSAAMAMQIPELQLPAIAQYPLLLKKLEKVIYEAFNPKDQAGSLLAKIEKLKDWKREMQMDRFSADYYMLIELLKKEYRLLTLPNIESYSQWTPEEDKKIREGLEFLINQPVPSLKYSTLSDGNTFAQDWISALGDSNRDTVFDDLIQSAIREHNLQERSTNIKYLKDLITLAQLLRKVVSPNKLFGALDAIKKIDSSLIKQESSTISDQPLIFGPKTEVMIGKDELGNFRIYSAEPEKLYKQIIDQETQVTTNIKQRQQNISKKLKELRASNPSVDAYFTERERIDALETTREEEKRYAKNLARYKWKIQIDRGSKSLKEEIEILNNWKRIADGDFENFYHAIEKVKNHFASALAYEEMNESDEQKIQLGLENAFQAFFKPLESVVLPSTGKSFAAQWISALDQDQRDQAINDLFNVLMIEFNNTAASNQKTFGNKILSMFSVIDFLGDFISPSMQLKALNTLKKLNPKSASLIDSHIEEINRKENQQLNQTNATNTKDAKELKDFKGNQEKRIQVTSTATAARSTTNATNFLDHLKETIESNQAPITKIRLLSGWKKFMPFSGYLPEYYNFIEQLKNEFASEFTEKLSAQETKGIEHGLADLIIKPVPLLSEFILANNKTFAQNWRDALIPKARDEVFNDLVNTVINQQTQENTPILRALLTLIELLDDLVAKEDRLVAVRKIKKIIPQSGDGVNKLRDRADKLIEKLAGQEIIPNITLNKDILFEKYAKELDQDGTDLLTQIELLKKMKEVATNVSLIQKFYLKLEDVKKDFLIEVGHEEMNASDERYIENELERLVGAFMHPLETIILAKAQKTFATQWVQATEQNERDETIIDLLTTLLVNFNVAKTVNQQQDAVNNMHLMIDAMRDLNTLISQNTRLKALNKFKNSDNNLTTLVNKIIKEMELE